MTTLAVGDVDGVPIAVSGSGDAERAVRAWDLAAHKQIGDQPIAHHRFWIRTVALTELDGVPAVISAGLSMRTTSLASPGALESR